MNSKEKGLLFGRLGMIRRSLGKSRGRREMMPTPSTPQSTGRKVHVDAQDLSLPRPEEL
jgi:hypothetical protein